VIQNQTLAKRYKVTGVPNIVMFNYGKKVHTLIGKKSEFELTKALDKVLGGVEEG